ncbi:hypothetical protein EZV62_004127 [Acer yangbiense]|uniref:TF-B3 domain-containing protein n=1 Tax=Acer yangbiense TaxID=1000413 RepID=A0A5C7IKR1_9ROSI|nr:hypothetical protein EZV62_004127 [Acer yangbiense]
MAFSLLRHGLLSRATMEHLETKHQVKQEPRLIMPILKRKKEEDDDDVVVSTELSVWLDYEPKAEKIKKPRKNDQKDRFLRANDVDQDQDLVTRDFVSAVAVNAMAYSSIFSFSLAIARRSSSVSTELELFCDPWKIKKILTKSDLGDLSRLLMRTSCVETHVLPFMGVDEVKQVVHSKDGLRVGVWDYDTHSLHQMEFKKWPSSKSYVLTLNWNKDFVKRRNLKEKDQIALFWDSHASRFWFHVLHQ